MGRGWAVVQGEVRLFELSTPTVQRHSRPFQFSARASVSPLRSHRPVTSYDAPGEARWCPVTQQSVLNSGGRQEGWRLLLLGVSSFVSLPC